jgi:hypothetical protein
LHYDSNIFEIERSKQFCSKISNLAKLKVRNYEENREREGEREGREREGEGGRERERERGGERRRD